ncbi:hypothetical protein P154DRAFT_561554 [Amniculicola lignicola CBS 123094]|uniref:Rhodopsin domain-containing protein n=1 Tax=Amniculicola lignicola CBS 123094 TaxID=1392246 RepID=A0A6A5WQ89_9PLEO|nr:hypothetical protein P154DRAFT_561554 [Amniculicola lignicola CBS 123094]
MALQRAGYYSYDTYLIWLCVYVGLASLAVVVRVWARMVKRSGLWWDDWCVVGGLVVFWGVAGIILVARSRADEDPEKISKGRVLGTRRLLFAIIELAIITITFARLSVIFLYYRLFSTTSRCLKILLYILGSISLAWMVSLVIATPLQCKPLGSYLDPFMKRTCINTQVMFVVGEGISCALDVVLVCLPVRLIWRLELRWKEKGAVCGMFLLGGVVVVSSFIVIFKTYDPKSRRYDPMRGSIWVSLQLSSALICACLPTYRPILKAHRHLLTPLSLQSLSSSPSPYSSTRIKKFQRSEEDMRALQSFRFPGSPRRARTQEWVDGSLAFGDEVERPGSVCTVGRGEEEAWGNGGIKVRSDVTVVRSPLVR